jgi:hypothetical protein
MSTSHLIGILAPTTNVWAATFQETLRRMGPVAGAGGAGHVLSCEQVPMRPFGLPDRSRYGLVIDRPTHRYPYPREWLKKAALVDGVYVLNNPFTFQSMEKHAAYCAMTRLGLKVPETALVRSKDPIRNAPHATAASRYQRPFKLEAAAQRIGYPLFMKPYDGTGGRDVFRIRNLAELHAAWHASGGMLMLLQKAIDGYDAFARSLSIGAETAVMRYQSDGPSHLHYAVDHSFLPPQARSEVVKIGRLINTFFGWEFNSCETLLKDDEVYPIDYTNACPDMSIVSLHYYLPWAVKTLVKWCVFVLVTGRRTTLDTRIGQFLQIADQAGVSYEKRLDAYADLADGYFETEHYQDFCASSLEHVDDIALDWIGDPDFDRLVVQEVRSLTPAEEQDRVIAHLRDMLARWIRDESTRLRTS